MLAPEAGSTNNDSSDKSPLVNSRIMTRLGSLFGRRNGAGDSSSSYVEFNDLEQSETRTLETFAGVFSPVSLSMFSALIFLRMGFIIGNAGLLITLLQFLIAYAILLFTVASICAIATNGAVEGGGAYFMISRTLGPEFGGSIGTLFFLANVVSSALCIYGCVEGLVEVIGPSGYLVKGLIPGGHWWKFLYCSCGNTLNLFICLIGAAMFAKTSVLILAVVVCCLGVSFFSFLYQGHLEVIVPESNTLVNISAKDIYTGLNTTTLNTNLWSHYGKDYTTEGTLVNFSAVFGVLFSGVTGIMAGANMSGELKNPSSSIPKGTLSAVSFTFVVYTTISFLIAFTCDYHLLQNNYYFMIGISVLPFSVAIGLFTATWSASLTSLIGGSRVLDALARDRVFGSLLDFIPKGSWNGNPVAAVIVSWFLVQIVVLIGSLNLIAQLNSVLFLLSYMATNLACLGLELASAPNFRPSFNYFTWHTALIGLIGTVIMMFVINPIYALCSIIMCMILVIFLHFYSPTKESSSWGSISQALLFHQVRKYLLLLDSRKDHVKFWRPQVLLLVNSPRSACPLIDFINDLKKGGLYVLGHVLHDDGASSKDDLAVESLPNWLNLIDHLKVKAFVEVTSAKTIREGTQHMMRLSGMGAMKPNTVVLGFLDKEDPHDFLQSVESSYKSDDFTEDLFPLQVTHKLQPTEYMQIMVDVLRMKKNLCLCRNFHKLSKDKRNKSIKYIDVWSTNFLSPNEEDAFDITSLFMMQLACIVNMVPKWAKLTLRLCICDKARSASFSLSSSQPYFERLKHLLKNLRISAELFPVPGWNNIIESHSNNSDTYLNSVNNMIQEHSQNTAVTFIYLPAPPTVDVTADNYILMLEKISQGLPPTIYVHGLSMVTSTTL